MANSKLSSLEIRWRRALKPVAPDLRKKTTMSRLHLMLAYESAVRAGFHGFAAAIRALMRELEKKP